MGIYHIVSRLYSLGIMCPCSLLRTSKKKAVPNMSADTIADEPFLMNMCIAHR